MAAEHLLALDAGTSGARALIARPGTGTVAVATRAWEYETPPEIAPLGKSFDAEAFWSALCEATTQALASARLSGKDIAAVGITSARFGLIMIDGAGRQLYAGPSLDARAIAEGLRIDASTASRVYASTGKLPSLLLAPARLQWLRNHHEDDFRRVAALLAIGDWVAYKLTSRLRSELSLAGDCGLLDVVRCQRDDELLGHLGVPPQVLPPLVSPTDVVGEVTASAAEQTGLAAGTPVVIAGADTQCALLGMGISEPGETGIAAGWSCPVHQVTAEPRFDQARRTWVALHVVPHRWVVESSAADAGRVWRWWCELLLGEDGTALDKAATLVAQAPAGAQEVIALLGPGAMNAAAMGLHLGGALMPTPLVVGSIGRAELLRAGLENIAYAMRANVAQAEEVCDQRATRIALGGGFTRIAAFPQMLADVLGRQIEVARDVEVTARGAALLAARAAGASEAALGAPTTPVSPGPDAEGYARRYERWGRLREALDATMKELP